MLRKEMGLVKIMRLLRTEALRDQQLNNSPASFPRRRESITGLLLTLVSYFNASPLAFHIV
jgi:hypothetical protein